MNLEQAQSAVSLSAFVVVSVYGYRKLTEGSTKTPVPPTAHFVIGFGFTYVTLAIVAQAAPELGGMFAVLIAVADLLANGRPLLADLTGALKNTRTATTG